jgi:hypothetical protein
MTKPYTTYRIRVANRDRVQVEKWDAQHQSLGEPSGVTGDRNLEAIATLVQNGSVLNTTTQIDQNLVSSTTRHKFAYYSASVSLASRMLALLQMGSRFTP